MGTGEQRGQARKKRYQDDGAARRKDTAVANMTWTAAAQAEETSCIVPYSLCARDSSESGARREEGAE